MTKEYVNLYDAHGRSLGATNEWQRVPDAFDYIIFTDGDVVKAKNGRTGKIEFKDSEIASVLQSIHDTSDGNISIFITPDTYVFNKPVLITKDNIEIRGVRGATRLVADDIDYVFTSRDESNYIHNPGKLSIHDLLINGAQAYSGSAWYLKFYNLQIDNPNGSGISLTDTSDPTGNCVDNWIFNNFFKVKHGIVLTGSATDNIIVGNIIFAAYDGDGIRIDNSYGQQVIGNHIYGIKYTHYGIFIRRSQDIVVVGNKIELAEKWSYGVYVKSDVGVQCSEIAVVGNFLHSSSSSGTKGVWIDYAGGETPPAGVVVTGNTFSGPFDTGILIKSGSDVDVGTNAFIGTFATAKISGALKKNSGTATFSGDGTTTQFAIEHGLISAPDKGKTRVWALSADAAGNFWIDVDDTYIYVNYLTAPPSGTDNVVLGWYAEV